MDLALRIIATLALAGSLLAAAEERATSDSVAPPRLALFPALAVAPDASARVTPARAPAIAPARIAFAVWDDLGESIRAAGERERAHAASDSPAPPADLLAPPERAVERPADDEAVAAGPSLRPVPAAGLFASTALPLHLEPEGPRGILTPSVDGVRGYLAIDLAGDRALSLGFAIEF